MAIYINKYTYEPTIDMLRIDTREKGNLPIKLLKLDNSVKVTLDAGDYHIDKPDGFIVIERTKLDDYIGKIKSGRIDDQIDKCKQTSDDVILLLEGMQDHSRSKMSYKAIISKTAAISQRGVQVICVRNSTESYELIKKIFSIYENAESTKDFNRVVPSVMTPEEKSMYVLMGIRGIGPKTAKKLLQKHGSIFNLITSSPMIADKYEAMVHDVCNANVYVNSIQTMHSIHSIHSIDSIDSIDSIHNDFNMHIYL